MNKELIMNPNQLVAFLEKPCAEVYQRRHKTIHSTEWHPYGSTLCIPPETDD